MLVMKKIRPQDSIFLYFGPYGAHKAKVKLKNQQRFGLEFSSCLFTILFRFFSPTQETIFPLSPMLQSFLLRRLIMNSSLLLKSPMFALTKKCLSGEVQAQAVLLLQ